MDRGNAVVRRADGTVLRRRGQVRVGDQLDIRPAEDQVAAEVTRKTSSS